MAVEVYELIEVTVEVVVLCQIGRQKDKCWGPIWDTECPRKWPYSKRSVSHIGSPTFGSPTFVLLPTILAQHDFVNGLFDQFVHLYCHSVCFGIQYRHWIVVYNEHHVVDEI